MDRLRLKAQAKINLGLDVLRRREDGYHEVKMIMQTVGIYDQIELVKCKEPGIRVKTNLFYVPENENNLVYKAAKILMDEFSIEEGVFIDLNKYIPVAAGMAGGSSDAASVLYGMNRMFRLGLSQQQLMERGVKIGADVPYCIMRGTALAEGIGEKLTQLPPMPEPLHPPPQQQSKRIIQIIELLLFPSQPQPQFVAARSLIILSLHVLLRLYFIIWRLLVYISYFFLKI